jgi:NAD(P)-dependent dehydrogenase (short-subunit alcohol dehydrogenase family)
MRAEVMLFISSVQAYMNPDSYGAVYGTSKMAATFLFQKMAGEFPPEKVQIISFHPGAVLTEPVRQAGYDENTLPWDNGMLKYAPSYSQDSPRQGRHSLLMQEL